MLAPLFVSKLSLIPPDLLVLLLSGSDLAISQTLVSVIVDSVPVLVCCRRRLRRVIGLIASFSTTGITIAGRCIVTAVVGVHLEFRE